MIGSTISHYKIIEKLGEGGMGVVYKAQDTNLDRIVALKFLPAHLATSHPERQRFIQEAKAAAALNHPNICTIYGIEDVDEKTFIVMEYVEGRTFRERKETVSMKQVIDIGIQIADGLTAAHEKGIVHRDIKPENIMIRKDGIAQIMDFGLAKLRGVSRLTKEGSAVGTVGYMSPEQVQGLDADHRSDIFSVGVLLYELFTGQLPFKGVHETAIAYEIVNIDSAPMSSIKPEVDPTLDAIVLECLEKDPGERYQSAAELAKDLRRIKQQSDRTRPGGVRNERSVSTEDAKQGQTDSLRFRKQKYVWLITSGLLLATLLFLASIHFLKAPPEVPTYRYTILPPASMMFSSNLGGHFAVSPDGRLLAFVAEDSVGKTHLGVRALSSLESQLFNDTEGAVHPFWSPDSRFIGFFAGGRLKKVEAVGGAPQTICDAPIGRGGSWNKDGTIVFGAGRDVPLSRVSAAGGLPSRITKLDTLRRETSHRWPHFLPDGRHFLYLARTEITGTGDNDAIFLSSLDTTFRQRLIVKASSNAQYANGYLFFAREQSLFAQPFDPEKLEFSGEILRVAEQVYLEPVSSNAAFSLSRTGILSYHAAGGRRGQLVWYDRNGKQIGAVLQRDLCYDIRLSPDEKRAAISFYDLSTRSIDISLCEFQRKVWERFTFDPAAERFPIWSPDGSTVVYTSFRGGHGALYQRVSNGAATEQLLLPLNDPSPSDWSRDGKFLAFTAFSSQRNSDIWILPMSGGHNAFPFLQTEFSESRATFSPDGHWIAYQSNESGSNQIYVCPFPDPRNKWRISPSGGTRPRWRGDGKELFYVSDDSKLMTVDLKLGPSTIVVGQVRALFGIRPLGTVFSELYDVTVDGQRFLVSEAAGESKVFSALTIVVNWDADLKKK
jgi:serine/threonine protein kinase